MKNKDDILIAASSEEMPLQATDLTAYPVQKPTYDVCKRIFDIVVSFIALVVLFVPLLLVALIIYIDSPGASPIFVQERVGKNGRLFRFFKFRSMVPNADELLEALLAQNEMEGPAFKMKKDPRITRCGRFLRRTGIDELPQLWNVLIGDMSLVGPRPPLPREVEQYTDYQRQRLLVVPGMTCYWQVQPKRNEMSFDQWMEFDMQYLRERGFATDMKILVKTVGAVCGMEGM